MADAELAGAVGDHLVHARAFDDAGQDRVDANVRRPELLGEALGEADDGEFGGRIGRAERIAVAARGRRHVDDRPAARSLQHRHGKPGAEELPGEADVDAAPPVGRADLVDTAGRSGDAGIVDEGVEPAELSLHHGEERVDVGIHRDVRLTGGNARQLLTCRGAWPRPRCRRWQSLRASVDSVLGDGKADAGGTRRHQHALACKAAEEIGRRGRTV